MITSSHLERLLRAAARERTHLVVEFMDCECCDYEGQQLHALSEVLKCPRCGHRQASEIPRPRDPGEPTAHHHELALQELAVSDPKLAMYLRDLAKSIAASEG